MDSIGCGMFEVRHPKFNPKVPIFSQSWLVVGNKPYYYTDPFSSMPLIQSEGKESSKDQGIEVRTIHPRENTVKETLYQVDTYVGATNETYFCAGPTQLKRKLTKKEVRRRLAGTELDGFENVSKTDIDRMSVEEREAKIFKILDHVLQDVEVIESEETIEAAPSGSDGVIYLD